MQSRAPPKAAAIMPRELICIEQLRAAIITSATTSLAPDEMPKVKGLAIGL